MRAAVVLVLVVAACSFTPGAVPGDGHGSGSGSDSGSGSGSGLGDVAHVPADVENAFAATAALAITNAMIDTGRSGVAPTINVSLPAGASLITSPQDGGGPELAILEVDSLSVTGVLTVRGQRPLVVIAKTTIQIDGVVDASADMATPGPGGAPARMGTGKGGDGVGDTQTFDDSGGAGGGFGTPGGAGQASGTTAIASTPGAAYGTAELATLEGGSGGGAMSPMCNGRDAGAGGGAIQLTSGTSIAISGIVAANGGGGSAGYICGGLAASAAGGGSGGAIYLQSHAVTGTGKLLAQGGSGGSGSNYNNSSNGSPGVNGPTSIAAATGGASAGTTIGGGGESNAGGDGGWRDAPPSTLTALSGANYGHGGGGGGAVGRIVVRAPAAGSLVSSPMAMSVPN